MESCTIANLEAHILVGHVYLKRNAVLTPAPTHLILMFAGSYKSAVALREKNPNLKVGNFHDIKKTCDTHMDGGRAFQKNP